LSEEGIPSVEFPLGGVGGIFPWIRGLFLDVIRMFRIAEETFCVGSLDG
jgi:hypothetical protein